MTKVIAMLIIAMCLMVVSCQPPEGMGTAGVTTQQIEELKTEIATLKTDVAALQDALDQMTTLYNEHIEKYHKGGTVAPKPKAPPSVQK
jgi:hypothetical protein